MCRLKLYHEEPFINRDEPSLRAAFDDERLETVCELVATKFDTTSAKFESLNEQQRLRQPQKHLGSGWLARGPVTAWLCAKRRWPGRGITHCIKELQRWYSVSQITARVW